MAVYSNTFALPRDKNIYAVCYKTNNIVQFLLRTYGKISV